MMQRFLICALVLGALVFAAAPAAQADNGCGYGGGYGWDYGYGYMYNILRYEVPHFAAFPPVYYSEPVPRTYGYSPFAYPPYVMTPEVTTVSEPVTIINPHVPQDKQKVEKPKQDRTASSTVAPEPLVIVNPFVSANKTLAQSAR